MIRRLLPQVGQWYKDLDRGDLFQVVALDERSATVEIQDFEGNLDEFDLDEWPRLDLQEAEPPEDWTGPLDDVEADDLGYTDAGAAATPDVLAAQTTGPWRDALTGEEDPSADEPPRHRPTLRRAQRSRRPTHH